MTNYEMAEKLSMKMGVSLEDAKAALVACNWDMLDAALMLEKERGDEAEAYTTRQPKKEINETASDRGGDRRVLRTIGRVLRKVLLLGNRNRFEVRRKNSEELVLDMPVTILVLLMLFAFWVCVPLLVIGLFAGFQYRFSGSELGREGINHAMDKASQAAGKMLDEIRKED